MNRTSPRFFVFRTPQLHRWVPFAVLAIACALTAGIAINIATREEMDAQTAFEAAALDGHRAVQVRLDTFIAVVRASSALLAATPEINYVEFRAFVSGLQLRERYPGIEGIGFAPRVVGRRLPGFMRDIRRDGLANVQIRPDGQRPEYFPTVLIEPTTRDSRPMLGFDLASEETQSAAMDRARDSGAPAITELIGTDSVLYLPVYRRGASVTTVADRRRALLGFVYSPFRPQVFLRESLLVHSAALALDVYDSEIAPSAALYSSDVTDQAPRFRSTLPMQVGGRQWLMVARSRGDNAGLLPLEAWRILVTGLLLSILLFALMRGQMRAWETADRHAAELVAADRAKDEFLAVLSHELRTPMNAVLGWLSMLRSGSMRAERREHALEVIDRNARAQAQLINDLLDISRIVMGRMRLDTRTLALLPAIDAVLDSARPGAEAKQIRLHGPEVSPEQAFYISADAVRLEQIMSNLVWNAVKFTPAGGDVWVDVGAGAGVVQVAVRDTGVGIAPEFLPHVFDRFRQADSSTTRTHSGIGMGLAIVRDLVQLHGGSIEARSEGRNRGAIFVVTFPLLNESAGADRGSLVFAEASPH